MMLRRGPAAATALLATLALTACGSSAADTPADDGTVTVVTTTDVYAAITSAVAGPDVEVDALIDGPQADPHSYESTPADAAAVARADLVVLNGGGYDDFAQQLVESAGGGQVLLSAVEVSGVENPGGFNEHVWYDLTAMHTLADRIADELSTLDPAGEATYRANAEAFGTGADALAERVAAIGPSVPDARVAVTEPVPGYLIEAAGLTDVTPEEFTEAVEEDSDPPAAVLAETLALFAPDAAAPVGALIVNAQTQTPSTDQVRAAAEAVGVPVIEMTETLPEGQSDYLTWMGAQVDALSGVLNPV